MLRAVNAGRMARYVLIAHIGKKSFGTSRYTPQHTVLCCDALRFLPAGNLVFFVSAIPITVFDRH
jgi:hypothetical protein